MLSYLDEFQKEKIKIKSFLNFTKKGKQSSVKYRLNAKIPVLITLSSRISKMNVTYLLDRFLTVHVEHIYGAL